jgi:glycosyltransferase involved in cell wall biosynthesis
MKILYIQYAGDFSVDYQRVIVEGKNEQYYGQKYCLDYYEEQSKNHEIFILVLFANKNKIKLNKIQYIGMGFSNSKIKHESLFDLIEVISPEKVILRYPDFKLLKYFRKNKIETLPILADSFEKSKKGLRRIKQLIERFHFKKEFSNPHIRFIANHQINACSSIEKLGVSKDKIIPYDWEHKYNPADWDKNIFLDSQNIQNIKLFFVGTLIKTKGIYDILGAIKILKSQNKNVTLVVAGEDKNNIISGYCRQLNITTSVKLLGKISNLEVMQHMLNSHAVVVASHSDYPEGLPMTIMESLVTHTPVILSTHPMFLGRIGSNNSVIYFKEKSATELAKKIETLQLNYLNRVENTVKEWEKLILKTKWDNIITDFVSSNYANMSKMTLEKFIPNL